MSLLQRLTQFVPELKPPERFLTQDALEAFLEGGLRERLEEEGLGYSLSRLPDGRYVAEVLGEEGRADALSFAGWKALAKAYLRLKGVEEAP